MPSNTDWLHAPIAVDPQPQPQPPQIDWATFTRWLPWGMLLACVVFWVVARRPSAEPTGVTGLRVLVIEETETRGDLSPEQIAIFNSVEIRERVQAADGQIVFLDADDKTRNLEPEWRRLRDRVQTRPPAVVIATPRRAKEMPLPADVETFLQTLEDFTK